MVKLRRVFESDLYLESKKDLDDLKAYLGDKLFDDYMKIRDKISDPNFKDFNKLKKMNKKDIQDFISSFQSKSDKKKSDKTEGARKLYEDEDWIVYKITSYPAAQLYGKNTKWCITGRYPGHEGRGEQFFNDYINKRNLDDGYYFYFNKKDPKEKYCVLQTKSGKIDSIWDAYDDGFENVKDFYKRKDISLPEVEGINLEKVPESYKDEVALHKAIQRNKIGLVKSLLEKEIDFNNDPMMVNYPFIFTAIDNGNKSIVKLLLDKGADPNINKSNMIPLLHAVKLAVQQYIKYHDKDAFGIVKVLLKYGADPNVKDKLGTTPLLYAADFGIKDLVELLLKYGADINVKDSDGETPLSLVRNNPYIGDRGKDTEELLLKYGAKE